MINYLNTALCGSIFMIRRIPVIYCGFFSTRITGTDLLADDVVQLEVFGPNIYWERTLAADTEPGGACRAGTAISPASYIGLHRRLYTPNIWLRSI